MTNDEVIEAVREGRELWVIRLDRDALDHLGCMRRPRKFYPKDVIHRGTDIIAFRGTCGESRVAGEIFATEKDARDCEATRLEEYAEELKKVAQSLRQE